VVVGIGPLRALGGAESARRPAGLPGRLRSLFTVPPRGSKAEPRVRYAQQILPGLAYVGRQDAVEARTLLERADAIRGRRFTYLGRTVGFPGRIEWEPTGLSEEWRVALNSLDDLIPLGVAATLAPNLDVRRKWYEFTAAFVREWIGGAGRDGVAWTVPCLVRRIPNLVWTHAFFSGELRADTTTRQMLLESLYAQTTALAAAHTSLPPDAFLIHAARALFVAGRFFDGMEARGWLETGANVLWAQLREQVNDDGGHRSRSIAQHAAVLADYVEVMALLQAANDDVPIWARKRVKAMTDFFVRLLHPDGELPLFHDAVVGVGHPAAEILAVAAVVLHEPDIAPPGPLPGIWPLFVLGDPGRRVHARLPRRKDTAEARALRRTGYYVLPGEAGDVLLLDGGTPPANGDGSALGYEVSVGGLRLLVDAGTGSEEAAPWREYFRSTRAHNVVSVGGNDQNPGGRPAAVSDVRWVTCDGLVYFEGAHDGFARLALDFRLHHRRRVFCLPGRFWVVCDEIVGSAGELSAESFIHLHPEAVLRGACNGRQSFVAARSDTAWMQIVPAGSPTLYVARGENEPTPQGWYASRHGERRSAPVLSLRTSGRLPLLFGYALIPRFAGHAELALQHDAFRLDATLRLDDEEFAMTVVQGDVEMHVRSR
jgi:uncharacterized heparinase superfamily protein